MMLMNSCNGNDNQDKNSRVAPSNSSVEEASVSVGYEYDWKETPFDVTDSLAVPESWITTKIDPLDYADAGLDSPINMAFSQLCGMRFGGFEGAIPDKSIPSGQWVDYFGRKTGNNRLDKSIEMIALRDPDSLKPIIMFNGKLLNLWCIVGNRVYYVKNAPFVSLNEYLSSRTSPQEVRSMILSEDEPQNDIKAYLANCPYELDSFFFKPEIRKERWKSNFAYVVMKGFGGEFYMNNKEDYDRMVSDAAKMKPISSAISDKDYKCTIKLESRDIVRDDVYVPGNTDASVALSNATMHVEVRDLGEKYYFARITDGGKTVIVEGDTICINPIYQVYDGNKVILQYFKGSSPVFLSIMKEDGVWIPYILNRRFVPQN